MKSFFTLALIVVVSTFAMAQKSDKKDDKEKKEKPGFQRVVSFQFKATATEAQRQKHMADFAAFVDQVPVVISYRAGKTVKGEKETEPEFHVLHYVTFAKEEDIITYDRHPAHKKFIDENRASWEKVFVANSVIDKK